MVDRAMSNGSERIEITRQEIVGISDFWLPELRAGCCSSNSDRAEHATACF